MRENTGLKKKKKSLPYSFQFRILALHVPVISRTGCRKWSSVTAGLTVACSLLELGNWVTSVRNILCLISNGGQGWGACSTNELEYLSSLSAPSPANGYSPNSNWILMSCQPHRITSGQSNSAHISKCTFRNSSHTIRGAFNNKIFVFILISCTCWEKHILRRQVCLAKNGVASV